MPDSSMVICRQSEAFDSKCALVGAEFAIEIKLAMRPKVSGEASARITNMKLSHMLALTSSQEYLTYELFLELYEDAFEGRSRESYEEPT